MNPFAPRKSLIFRAPGHGTLGAESPTAPRTRPAPPLGPPRCVFFARSVPFPRSAARTSRHRCTLCGRRVDDGAPAHNRTTDGNPLGRTMSTGIPAPRDDDPEEVSDKLSIAAAMWARGETADAI